MRFTLSSIVNEGQVLCPQSDTWKDVEACGRCRALRSIRRRGDLTIVKCVVDPDLASTHTVAGIRSVPFR